MANKNKEKKNTNIVRNILFILIAVIVIAAIAVMFFKGSFENRKTESETESISSSDIVNANGSNTNNVIDNISDNPSGNTSDSSENQTTEKSTAKPYSPSKNYSLPLNVKEVLDMLSDHYGKDYQVNSTVTENEYNYFAVVKNGEKYASVKVNLSNGDATETIIETGQTSDFNLV
ncbi:MAG: hypothetical protein K2K71_04555 [Eubacterium sp.]|nr:hypothetical protein [Eubacterium sp.]MDE6506505.1 hypothetical protein [Eubacterium sp.]